MTAPSQRHGMYGESSAPSTTRQARKATTGTVRSGAAVTPARGPAAGAAARRAGAWRPAPERRRALGAARRRRSWTVPAASWWHRIAPGAQADAVADGQQREQPLRRAHERAGGAPRGRERLVAPGRVEPLRQCRLAAHEQVVDHEDAAVADAA